MKYYDKTLYKIEQNIKTDIFILIIFIISFIFGFFTGNAEIRQKDYQIKQLQIEIDNLENKTIRKEVIFMFNINTKELEIKWKQSQNQISQLLRTNDKATIKMFKFYTLYIQSPFDKALMDLFELAFNSWYKEKMKG